MKELFAIGYWHEDYLDYLPNPNDLINNGFWQNKDKTRVIDYLKSADIQSQYQGHSYCRIKNGPEDSAMGSADLSDGYWIWPEGLWVYVNYYDVMLPEDFIVYMQKCDYIPGSLCFEDIRNSNKSFDYWIKWSLETERKTLRWFIRRFLYTVFK